MPPPPPFETAMWGFLMAFNGAGPFFLHKGEYLPRCARSAREVRVLGLFRRPFHPEPIRGMVTPQSPPAHQVPSTTPLLVDQLLEKLFKCLARCAHRACAVRILPHSAHGDKSFDL